MVFSKWLCARAQRTARHVCNKTLVFKIAIVAAITAICSSMPLLAQNPSPYYPDFSSTANLVLNGIPAPPAVVNKALRLTPAQPSQVGAAWYSFLQPVSGGFSTSFTYQISNPSVPTADGFAFVIQNSAAGTAALGGGGGGIGYQSIGNSLAIEFDTYANTFDPEWDGTGNAPANHVAIQNCGPNNPNSADHTATYNGGTPCKKALATAPIKLADGKAHNVRIDYNSNCGDCSPSIQVYIDGMPVFDGAVFIDIGATINLASLTEGGVLNSAYVGFTAGTGSYFENHDIKSWSFTPQGSNTITMNNLPPNQFTTFTFGSYLYKVRPNRNINQLAVTEVPVNPAPIAGDPTPVFDPGPNFPKAQCVVYDSTGGKCIEFHAVCTPPVPDDNSCKSVSYDVVTSYDVPSGTNIDPDKAGFLKASGQPCPPAVPFDSNIITQFLQTRTDPTTKGSSKPSFSCFVAVQNVTYQPANLDILNLAAAKVRPNTNLTYVATVGNFGPSAAQGVAISNPIPSGTAYVNSALCSLTNGCSNTTCSFDGSVASCLVGNLDKFGLEFMVTTVKVTATAGTVLSDTATVTSFNPDPDSVLDRSWTAKTLVSSSSGDR
jgi:uncharacterized repeat protein (TIGR01451 family)